MTIKLNDEELTLLETITRESLSAFISEGSKVALKDSLSYISKVKVYKSLHHKAQTMCIERAESYKDDLPDDPNHEYYFFDEDEIDEFDEEYSD